MCLPIGFIFSQLSSGKEWVRTGCSGGREYWDGARVLAKVRSASMPRPAANGSSHGQHERQNEAEEQPRGTPSSSLLKRLLEPPPKGETGAAE